LRAKLFMDNKTVVRLLLSALFLSGILPMYASAADSVVVFSEPGFPAADSASPSVSQLQVLFPGARLATLAQLETSLNEPANRLFVLPYGSAFPEEAWERAASPAVHDAQAPSGCSW
jgi:hypothetical protein